MSEPCRFASVLEMLQPFRNDATTCGTSPFAVHPASISDAWAENRHAIANAIRAQPRPGLFVFSLHALFGVVGRLWLQATAEPRAGTLGRHECLDLGLPLDRALSLRHALFVVRNVNGVTRTTVVDLASSSGMRLHSGEAADRFDVEGPFAVRLGEFLVLALPTGAGPCPDALQLATPTHVRHRGERRGPLAGRVTLRTENNQASGNVTVAELARGVLVGRNERCDLEIGHNTVSRVHAVPLDIDGEVIIVDAGSTNGMTRRDGRLVRCEPIRAEPVWLANVVSLSWTPLH